MKISILVSFSGIGLVVMAVILLVMFQIVVSSNSPQYSTGKLVLEPDQSDIKEVMLHEEKAELRLYVKEKDSLVKVTLVSQHGEKIGELESDKRFDHIIIDNLGSGKKFSLVVTNVGYDTVTLTTDIRDFKEPGTFLDTPDAIFLFIPVITATLAAGVVVLFFSAGIGYVEWKKTTNNRKFN